MNARGLRRYIDDLLGGRRPRPFQPDEFEAAQIRTAIELRAARRDDDAGDVPRPEFLADLHRRLAEQQADTKPRNKPLRPSPIDSSPMRPGGRWWSARRPRRPRR